MKIIDVDKLFDEYISDYVYKSIGKVKPEEIENKIPELYTEFGKVPLKELDGKTSEEYYKDFSTEELLKGLTEHINEKVTVPDFLCEAITEKRDVAVLTDALNKDNREEFTVDVLNFIKDIKEYGDGKKFIPLIKGSDTVRELATEILNEIPDSVAEELIKEYNLADKTVKESYAEILSHAKKRDGIFEILIDGFKIQKKNTALYCGYLARYGDERALPYLNERIKEKND